LPSHNGLRRTSALQNGDCIAALQNGTVDCSGGELYCEVMGPIVRETVCKTILNRSGLSDYSLNCYTGCTHGCAYCYARYMQRFHPHQEPWGAFVDVKVNAVEVLKRQLRRARPGSVFVSSACDGWQPLEAEWRLTRRCCELLLERGFEVHVLSKSDWCSGSRPFRQPPGPDRRHRDDAR